MKSGIIAAVDRILARIVSAFVVAVVLTMVLLSFSQILLRNLTGGGISWADVVLRHLVLNVGMFAAILATRQGRQISIDVLGKVIPERYRPAARWITGLFTLFITILMTRVSILFVSSEHAFGTEITPGIAAWPFQLAIPVGFSLIGLQVILNLILGRAGSQHSQIVEQRELPDAKDDSGEEEPLATEGASGTEEKPSGEEDESSGDEPGAPEEERP